MKSGKRSGSRRPSPSAVTILYKVQLIGQQEISKTIAGVAQHNSRQIVFTLALKPDTGKRTEDNQNTGFRIAGIVEMKILAEQAGAGNKGGANPPTISVATPQPPQ